MNEIKLKKKCNIGMSIAASWAWGTSLIMGMQIAHEKGVVAFWIWAIANSLTLYLFSKLYPYIKDPMVDNKIFKVFALAVQIFCLIIQLNVINQIINNYMITCAIGVAFVVIVFKDGIFKSISTDMAQWSIMIISIIAIILVGYTTGAKRIINLSMESSNIRWALYSALVLFSGPIGDLQHHQRARVNVEGYKAGAWYFFLYMCLLFVMSLFEFNSTMNFILLIATLCVTTSTIDSIAVSLHELCNKKVGTGIALILCFAWTIFVDWGVLNIWSKFGYVRIGFAVALILVGLYKYNKKGETINVR